MAQFDVHRNTGRNRVAIPYVVVVQSSLYDGYQRRVVLPLVRRDVLGTIAEPRLNPSFVIEDTEVVLHPLEVVSIPVTQLGEKVDTLTAFGSQIILALDHLLCRAWN